MKYRPLGSTGLCVSAVAFGAGPVSGLLTGDAAERQREVIAKAVACGINWFDTAATYGNGHSERGLGRALATIRAEQPLHVATKVRLRITNETDLRPLAAASLQASLERLGLARVTLLQIHNSITWNRGDQPTSITPDDVLGPQGLLAGMEDLRAAGLVDHFGLTGIGDTDALRTVMESEKFATIQAPFHLLNPSALLETPEWACDPDYGGFLQDAHRLGMAIFAIRVFAAGALIGAEPSAHTLTTPFFPLALYQRDRERARRMAAELGSPAELHELALRYVLSQPQITSAIVGLGAVAHVEEAARLEELGPLSPAEIARLEELRNAGVEIPLSQSR